MSSIPQQPALYGYPSLYRALSSTVSDAGAGIIKWGDAPNDYFLWEGNPDTGAMLWNALEDGLIWE